MRVFQSELRYPRVAEYKTKLPEESAIELQLPLLSIDELIGIGLLTLLKSIPALSPNIQMLFWF